MKMAEQINIFLDNKPGRLRAVTGILDENGINLRAVVIQDHSDYGLVKMLVDDPGKTYELLVAQGFACAIKKILTVLVPDRPGGMHQLFTALDDAGINVLDSYGFVIQSRKEAAICIEVEDPKQTAKVVQENGFETLTAEDIYNL